MVSDAQAGWFGRSSSEVVDESASPAVEASLASSSGTRELAVLADCPTPERGEAGGPAQQAEVRSAAQAGLTFLSEDTVRWQQQHACYGCHVQAVTLKALAVGEHNQYDVSTSDLREVVRGITELPGGSRTGQGLRYAHGSFLSASRSLGGAAFAQYDEWVDGELRQDLLLTAEQLLGTQQTTGAVTNDYTSPPVAVGPLQDTVLAMASWNQAYARTADDRWLTGVARAEDWVQSEVAGWNLADGGWAQADLQRLNYALMGLHEAGTGATEPVVGQLVDALVRRQSEDGGWSLQAGGASDAYATGQTLYTLRLMGRPDSDPSVARGTAWLIGHQDESGGWSHSGRQRAEAMWGVLGLVSVDVLTLAVQGIQDGQHVDGTVPVSAQAFDNQSDGVVRVELRVDDLAVDGACGDAMQVSWDASGLEDGPHVVDVLAVNAEGKRARRRFEVFAGSHYLTRVGSRWDDEGTLLSLRNIAPAERENTVRVRLHTVDEEDQPVREVRTLEAPGRQGPMSFYWDGKDTTGEPLSRGRFMAVLEWMGSDGEVAQRVEHVFVHDTPAAQQQQWAAIAGQLQFDDGDVAAATTVELVNAAGEVVSQVGTTRSGQYRFKNVREGNYSVRVRKAGYVSEDQEVEAAAGAESNADVALH